MDGNVCAARPIALGRGEIHQGLVIELPINAAFGRNDTAAGRHVRWAAGEWPVRNRLEGGILLLITDTTEDGELGVDVEFRVRKGSLRLITEVLIGNIGKSALMRS